MAIDAIVSLAGLVIPPVADFIKKKFIKREADTPERTMGTLAETKPEVLPEYLKAIVEHLKAKKDYFNRDVVGETSPWVNNLRASIRPCAVVLSLLILATMGVSYIFFPELALTLTDNPNTAGVRYTCEAITTSWFGDRIRLK